MRVERELSPDEDRLDVKAVFALPRPIDKPLFGLGTLP